jgi:hypothetical protein
MGKEFGKGLGGGFGGGVGLAIGLAIGFVIICAGSCIACWLLGMIPAILTDLSS